jgi:hypothetical protein
MKKITKIVTFYDDGTFDESTPSLAPLNPPVPYTPWNPSMPYQPNPTPVNPWTQPYPWPNTVWCKTADGTITEMTLTSPIVAQGDTNV